MKYPTLKFVFDRKHLATKTTKGLVQIEVLSERKRKWIGTGIKLYAGQWDDRRMVINDPEMLELNSRLLEQRRQIQDWVEAMRRKGEEFEFDKLDRFLRHRLTPENFIKYVRNKIEERKDIRESSKKTQRKLVSSLEAFGGIVYFTDLTKKNIMAYDEWLHGKGYLQPTIHSYHKFMKIYINMAIRSEIIENSPYSTIKIDKGHTSVRKYLTIEEVRKIEKAKIDRPTIDRVRDLFIFQCYTGLAYAELAKFDFTKVIQRDGKYVLYDSRQKTEETYYIVLLPPVISILQKYNFKLPIICNQQYNLRLKIVADYAGLDKDITSHTGRHTFATLALEQGVPIENVCKMLGHSDIKTTQIYAKILNTSVEKSFDLMEQKLFNN